MILTFLGSGRFLVWPFRLRGAPCPDRAPGVLFSLLAFVELVAAFAFGNKDYVVD